MEPRKTRSVTAATRLTTSNNASSMQVPQHQALAENEEYKAEDPASDHGLERQAQTQTPQLRNSPPCQDVFSGTFLSNAGRNLSALSKRLKHLWQTLQHTSSHLQQQEDGVLDVHASQQVQLVASELLQEAFLQHPDPYVRSLVACCLVEMLRVSAPDSPFSSQEDLYRVFQLFLEQLQALGQKSTTKATELHHVYLLESLVTAKTCLLLVDLDYTENDETRVMVRFVATLFDVIDQKHTTKLENLMLSLMVTCIEESGEVKASLLDVILRPLVNAEQLSEKNGTMVKQSARLARQVIQRTSDVLQNTLSQYLNNILVDASGKAELKQHIYTIIYELHKIKPSLLLYVLPNVCLQLQADDVATRSDAITLMGKLFASSHAEYGHDLMKNFREFLGRFRDASKDIRLLMIRVSVSIWESKRDLAELVEKELILRLRDPEWEVRQLVVREVCDFAANCLEWVSEDCLRAVGERMKDKKVALRKETMTGLSQVFSTHISSYWEEQDGEEDQFLSLTHHTIPLEHIEKLGWIPDYVLKCYAYPQEELKLRVIQLLDDFLLPKALTERTRANGLLFLFHSLDTTSKEALRRLFRERAKCQENCAKFVAFKVQQRRQKRTDDCALDKATQEFYDGLCPLFSDVVNLKKLLEKFSKWKDHSVFKHLGELCDFTKPQCDIRRARDELVRSVGSKTALSEFFKKLCRKLPLLTLSYTTVDCYLDFLVVKGGRLTKENRSLVDLLVIASSELPGLFDLFIRDRFAAILAENKRLSRHDNSESGSKDPNVILGALSVLANYAQHWANTIGLGDDASIADNDSRTPSKELVEQLQKFCLGDNKVELQHFNVSKKSRAAGLAALTIAYFYGKAKHTKQLVKKLCSKEKLGDLAQIEAMPLLQSLVVFSKRCSHIFFENQPLFSLAWTLLFDKLKSKEVSESSTPNERTPKSKRMAAAKITEIRCLAIRVLVNLLVYSPNESSQDASTLIQLLFEILRSDGKSCASTNAQAAMFRATASCGLMKMMRIRHVEALISVSEWHLLGLSIQDSSEDVRRQFLKKLTSHLVKQPMQHPHKYLSYLALAATETTSSVKKEARHIYKIAVERMRRTFDATSEISSPEQDSSLSALMVPEYALPYVIHLLAHHPAFPMKLVEKTPTVTVLHSAEWTDQLAYLEFFLDGLVSAKSAADNIAFLLQILTKLSQYHDVLAPNDIAIYPLIDSTAVLLKKKIKKQSDLKPFPGRIFLPKHLFSLGRPSTLATPGGRKEPEAPDSLPLRGSRLGASLSPIKPMDFASHFMKLHSPPGSSLKSSRKKRKRSLLTIGDEVELIEEEMKDDRDEMDETISTSARRQSVLGQSRPERRTFADDSSESGAESDRGSLSIASVASSLHSVASRRVIADTIVEEEKETEVPVKKRMSSEGVAADVSVSYEKPRLRSARQQN